MKRRGNLAAIVLLLAVAGAAGAQAVGVPIAGVPPTDRVAGALALIDLRALAQYDFAVDTWPKLGVTPWPVVSSCLPPSELSALLGAMEAALNRQDIAMAMQKARALAYSARDTGLGPTAIGIAEVVAAYAEQQTDESTRGQMAQLIRELEIRRGATPEYSAREVPQWLLALKPKTLFVGTNEAVRALGLAEIRTRFANMLDVLSQDMAKRRDLSVCTWHPEAPDHLIRDYWVMIQRFRIDAAKLGCLLADGKIDPVVAQVGYFNGSWGIVREIALVAGCSTRGAYTTWK